MDPSGTGTPRQALASVSSTNWPSRLTPVAFAHLHSCTAHSLYRTVLGAVPAQSGKRQRLEGMQAMDEDAPGVQGGALQRALVAVDSDEEDDSAIASATATAAAAAEAAGQALEVAQAKVLIECLILPRQNAGAFGTGDGHGDRYDEVCATPPLISPPGAFHDCWLLCADCRGDGPNGRQDDYLCFG